MSWAYFDPEYETLNVRINPPQVSVDNSSCKDCTLVKVDSMNKPGILLEVVQILTDLDLIITKAYISSDGGWFMDVFHVTDQKGQKIADKRTIEHIEKALGPNGYTSGLLKARPGKTIGVNPMGDDYTVIELIGRDRPGLLSEISAVLANLSINVYGAEVWTHNNRIACVLYVSAAPQLSLLKEQLKNILGNDEEDNVGFSSEGEGGSMHVDRRLHQLLSDDRDYEGCGDSAMEAKVTVERLAERDYSVVNVRCRDRPKLMFDIVCTLTDMQYIVFHATVSSEGPYASQEYYIRHKDGCPLETEAEKEKVVKCLEAAIRRRVSEGLSLELCAKDRVGLLSEVTRVLRENGLSVTRAGVSTVGEQAMNVFYVTDASGKPVDGKTVEDLRKQIGETMRLNVKRAPTGSSGPKPALEPSGWAKTSFFFGSLFDKFRG